MTKVWLMWGWDDGDDEKQVLICQTKEIAEEIASRWKKNGWDNATIKEQEIIESTDPTRRDSDAFTFESVETQIKVRQKVTGDLLGLIDWSDILRNYAFYPYSSTFYDSNGLREISEFLDALPKKDGLK